VPEKRILLVGGYGVGNYGDEAILAGLLSQLPNNAEKIAISHDPEETFKLHGVHAIHPVQALKSLGKFDSIIISGGLFGGNMGKWGKLVPLFCLASKAFGVDVEFRGLGVYPSAPRFLFPMIKASTKVANEITVRDKVSKRTLARMGINDVSLTEDLAFHMNPAPKDRAMEILENEEVAFSKKIVGISVTRMNSALANKVTSIVREVIKKAKDNSEILFLPMCRHKKSVHENDYLYSKEFVHEFHGVKILHGCYHPSELLSIFGVLSSCICMRFHSMVFAHRMGINMIPIPYAEKCTEFLRDIGLESARLGQIVNMVGGEI